MKKSFEYPVNVRHSTVLGYTATSQYGSRLWDELDWRGVREDGGQHQMNPAGGEYLHVRCKYNLDQDGPRPCPIRDRRWYRVRCLHQIGTKWRGGIVVNVKVKKLDQYWMWSVDVNRKNSQVSTTNVRILDSELTKISMQYLMEDEKRYLSSYYDERMVEIKCSDLQKTL